MGRERLRLGRVWLKRHLLYCLLGQGPVHVLQTAQRQILETRSRRRPAVGLAISYRKRRENEGGSKQADEDAEKKMIKHVSQVILSYSSPPCLPGHGMSREEERLTTDWFVRHNVTLILHFGSTKVNPALLPGVMRRTVRNLSISKPYFIFAVGTVRLKDLPRCMLSCRSHQTLISFHPETQDKMQRVSNSKRRHFSPGRVRFGVPPLPDCPAPH